MRTPTKVLILVLAVVLLGATAYGFKWQSNKNKNSQVSTQSPTQSTIKVDDGQPDPRTNTSKPAETVTEDQGTYKGERVESSEGKFSIVIPNGWKPVTNCSNLDYIFVVGEREDATLAYDANTPPTINQQSCGDDSVKVFSAGSIFEAEDTTGWENFTTNDRASGKRICEENVTVTGLNSETYLERCRYQFTNADKTFSIRYLRKDSSYADRKELIDNVVKSLKIL